MQRKAPTQSATANPLGTTKRGNDGKLWVVVATSTGVRRWKRKAPPRPKGAKSGAAKSGAAKRGAATGETAEGEATKPEPAPAGLPKKKERPAKLEGAAPKAAKKTRSAHRILFCEPSTYSRANPHTPGVPFKVSDDFYPALLRAPKAYTRGSSNAYVFGEKHPLETYRRAGGHGNDVAQTGLIDVDLLDDALQATAGAVIGAAFKPLRYSWGDRAALRKVRAQIPHILFLGETAGGDVGADLYVHSTHGSVDSIIVDNNYYFRRGEV